MKKSHVITQDYFNECDWGERQMDLTDLSEWQIKLKESYKVMCFWKKHLELWINPITTEDLKLKPTSSSKEDLQHGWREDHLSYLL